MVAKHQKIDFEAGGGIKHKSSAEMGDNEKAILKGELYDPIGYEWMFKILRDKYREQEGTPIVRIMVNWAKRTE